MSAVRAGPVPPIRLLERSPVSATSALLFISASMTVEVFYVKDVLHAGDAGYALLWGVWMAGMAAGAGRLATRVPPRAMAAGSLVALAVHGAGWRCRRSGRSCPWRSAATSSEASGTASRTRSCAPSSSAASPTACTAARSPPTTPLANTAELGALGTGGLLVTAIGPRPALLLAGLGPVVAGLAGLAALQRRGGRPPALAPAPSRV